MLNFLQGTIHGYPLAALCLTVAATFGIWRPGVERRDDKHKWVRRIFGWLMPPGVAFSVAWFFAAGNLRWAVAAAAGCVLVRIGAWIVDRFRDSEKDTDDVAPTADLPPAARTVGFLIGAAGVFTVAAFVPLEDVLGLWVGNGWGLTILAIAGILLAFGIYYEWWHLRGYHQFWTSVMCYLGGVVAVTTYAVWDRMARKAARIVPGIGGGINSATDQIATGSGGHAVKHLTGINGTHATAIGGYVVIGLIFFVLVGGPLWAKRRHKKMKEAAARRRQERASRTAVGSGGRRPAIGG